MIRSCGCSSAVYTCMYSLSFQSVPSVAVLCTPAFMRCHFSLYCLDLAAWDVEPVVCHVAETVLCTPACIHCHFSPYRLDLTAWGVEPVVCHVAGTVLCTP